MRRHRRDAGGSTCAMVGRMMAGITMDTRYYTVRLPYALRVGDKIQGSQFDSALDKEKHWQVMFAPVQVVSGGFAVTFQECEAPAPTKGPVGDMVHSLLRSAPPEPTLGMIYAELQVLRASITRECIFEFSEDRVPTFRNGPAGSQHELEEIVDAKRCTELVTLVDDLRREVARLQLLIVADKS